MINKLSKWQIIFLIICWPGEIICLIWLIIESIRNKIPLLEIQHYVDTVWILKLKNNVLQNILGAINVLIYIWIFS